MPDGGYAAQPPAALRESAGAVFDSLVRALESGEVRELRAFAVEVAAERAKQGFRLSEPLRAFAELRSGMERVLRVRLGRQSRRRAGRHAAGAARG